MPLHHFFNTSYRGNGKYEVASAAVDAVIHGAKSHSLLDRKPTPRGGVTPGPTLSLLFLSNHGGRHITVPTAPLAATTSLRGLRCRMRSPPQG